MERDLEIMQAIQAEKEKDIAAEELQELNPEGKTMGEHKRFTFDIVETPSDPLR